MVLPCSSEPAYVPVRSWNTPPRPHKAAPTRNLLSSTTKARQEKGKIHLLLWREITSVERTREEKASV